MLNHHRHRIKYWECKEIGSYLIWYMQTEVQSGFCTSTRSTQCYLMKGHLTSETTCDVEMFTQQIWRCCRRFPQQYIENLLRTETMLWPHYGQSHISIQSHCTWRGIKTDSKQRLKNQRRNYLDFWHGGIPRRVGTHSSYDGSSNNCFQNVKRYR